MKRTMVGVGIFLLLLGQPVPGVALLERPYGWFGVGIMEVSENLSWELAAQFGFLEGHGVVVTEVMTGAPAEAAGMRRGDVIIQVGSWRIWGVRGLQGIVRRLEVGHQTPVVVLRGQDRLRLDLTIGRMPEAIAATLAGEAYGLWVRGERRDDGKRGAPAPVRVVGVERRSPADRAGIRVGDLIVAIGDRPVESPMDYGRGIREGMTGGTVRLTLQRSLRPLEVSLELKKRPAVLPEEAVNR